MIQVNTGLYSDSFSPLFLYIAEKLKIDKLGIDKTSIILNKDYTNLLTKISVEDFHNVILNFFDNNYILKYCLQYLFKSDLSLYQGLNRYNQFINKKFLVNYFEFLIGNRIYNIEKYICKIDLDLSIKSYGFFCDSIKAHTVYLHKNITKENSKFLFTFRDDSYYSSNIPEESICFFDFRPL